MVEQLAGDQGIAHGALGYLAGVDRPVVPLPALPALGGPTENDRDQHGLGRRRFPCPPSPQSIVLAGVAHSASHVAGKGSARLSDLLL